MARIVILGAGGSPQRIGDAGLAVHDIAGVPGREPARAGHRDPVPRRIELARLPAAIGIPRAGLAAEDACRVAIERGVKKRPEASKSLQVCFLALNRHGEVGAFALHQGFVYAVCDATKALTCALSRTAPPPKSVSIAPGATAFTRIPRAPSSLA